MKGDRKVVITGGHGCLARQFAIDFDPDFDVLAPGRSDLDVECEPEVEAYFSQIDELDLLVCNAGKTVDQLFLKMDEATWDQALSANLNSAFYCARAAAKKMIRQRGGHIVFVSSYSAFVPHVGQANYAAAKAGLIGLAKSLAKELGGRGVRVNVIVPGWLETTMTDSVSQDMRERVRNQHSLKQFNTLESVSAFLHTLHTKMPFTSGQVFHLDSRIT